MDHWFAVLGQKHVRFDVVVADVYSGFLMNKKGLFVDLMGHISENKGAETLAIVVGRSLLCLLTWCSTERTKIVMVENLEAINEDEVTTTSQTYSADRGTEV